MAASRKSSWNKARIHYKRMCLPLDYLDLTHTDRLIASPETKITNEDKGRNSAIKTAVGRTVMWVEDFQI